MNTESAKQDETAIEAIIQNQSDTVYKLAYSYTKNKYDADDIYQEVFLRFFKRKPEFQNEEHTKAWFIRTTINCCKSLYFSNWFKRTVVMEEIQNDTADILKEEDSLFQAVMELPGKYREVIHLFYYEEYSVKEIARILKRSESSVTTQLNRGRSMLKKMIGGCYYET